MACIKPRRGFISKPGVAYSQPQGHADPCNLTPKGLDQRDRDVSTLSREEQTVYLAWLVHGVVGNGGFRYLLEGTIKGDPYFALSVSAFRAIGCKAATGAFEKTLGMFPNSRPPRNIEKRLRHYLSQITESSPEGNKQFWDAGKDLTKCLATYVRSHAEAFEHLERSRFVRWLKNLFWWPFGSLKQVPQETPVLADLPHWARVAFAARCARKVLPLLHEHWPAIPKHRSTAVETAIELAELSAAQARPTKGLKNAVAKATVVAGGALASSYGFDLEDHEPSPPDALSGTIASFATRAAERAAEAARSDPRGSISIATESWIFAMESATSADHHDLSKSLGHDLFHLRETAKRGKWTDRTKVPPEIWLNL